MRCDRIQYGCVYIIYVLECARSMSWSRRGPLRDGERRRGAHTVHSRESENRRKKVK